MKKMKKTRLLPLLLAAVLLVGVAIPATVFARDWWMMEAIYTVSDREPDAVCGPETRVFLPTVSVTTIDFIEEDAVWSMTKDGEEISSGDYEPGLYVDLTGAGTYVLTIKGVDATNALEYEITAQDSVESFISDTMVPLNTSLTQSFVTPAAEFVVNGERKSADISLLMANGDAYEYDGNAAPETGLMTVQYSADFNGQLISKDFDVVVFDDTLGFYGEDGTFYPSFVTPLSKYSVSGCELNGSSDEKYTFSQILDLSACTLDEPLIVLDNGSEDSNVRPHVFITDAHDPTNYIEIVGRASVDNNNMVYTVAAVSGGTMIGHIGGGSFYNGSIFGTETTFARSAQADRNLPAMFYYDAAEKAVYANWYGQVHLIADFDADYQLKQWKGFTTGEVYLQVKRHDSNDYVLVESVCGRSLGSPEADTVAPALKIDVPSEVPYAIAGQPFAVYEAKAYDCYESVLPVSVHVYQGSGAQSGIEMNVSDGKFVPADSGWYTIVYSTSDSYGNAVSDFVNVQAVASADSPSISASISGVPSALFVGEKLMAPKPQNVSGGSGALSCDISLTSPSGEVIDASENELVLTEAGKYVLTYTFSDYVGNTGVYEYPIECSATDKPILYDVAMPETILAGGRYEFPTAEVYNAEGVEVSVSASLDGKQLTITDNLADIETTDENAVLNVTYTAKNSAGTSEKTYTVPVMKTDAADRTSYFKVKSGSFDIAQEENSISFTTSESNSSVRFANAVLAEKLMLQLTVNSEQNDSDRISVLVYDSVQTDVAVRLDMVKKANGTENDKTQFYINGVQGNDMVGNFNGGVAALSLTYKKATKSFADSEGNSLGKLTTTLNGDAFNGFPSGKVFVVISAGTVGEKGFRFNLSQLNNQAFASDDLFFDNYPELSVNGTIALQADVGATISIPSAYACDVLSPYASLNVSARRDMESLLEATDIEKPLELTLDSFGSYYVSYNYSDGSVERSVTYQIQAMEHNAPQCEEVTLPKEAKLGSKVEIPQMTATDDASETVTVSVIVLGPDYNMHNILPEDMSFTANKAGKWTVIYYVYDSCWNYQTYSYDITVK